MAKTNEYAVRDFYKGKNIFVTGASGFMGKVLIEKLLYSCPDIAKIFILTRPKKGKSVNIRIEDMWKLPVFSRLREAQPDAIKKIVAIQGDVLFDNLGLDASSIELLQKTVDIVFHCAATLRLEAKLKDAIDMNTTGTWRIIEICRKMTNLKVFVHLSTAFCYADFETLSEKVMDSSASPQDLMRLIQWMDEKALDNITPALLGVHPNTYTYSKRLAESLVRDEYPKMPMVIARPSIVCPAWEEPVQGWVDNLNGPVGLMVGAGKGVIRSMHCNGDLQAQVIPVDAAISGLIVLAYREATATKKVPEIPVYNLSTSENKSTTWAEVLEIGRATVREYPFDSPLWYPDGNIRKSKLVHDLCVFFFHLIPAYFIDFIMLLIGQKRFMVRIQSRISDGLEVLQFFTTRQWVFNTKNFTKLFMELSPTEKKVYNMDFSTIDDKEYIKRCILGGRQYCLKEPLSSLPRARFVNNILFWADRIITVLFYTFLVWMVYKYTWKSSLVKALPGMDTLITN